MKLLTYFTISILILIFSGLYIHILMPLVISTTAFFLLGWREKVYTRKLLTEKVSGKVWDIPIVIDCGDSSCMKSHKIDFSLNTTHFVCDNCGKTNKLSISFTALPL